MWHGQGGGGGGGGGYNHNERNILTVGKPIQFCNILYFQLCFLRQTAMSRCEGLLTFQELTVPIFRVCWWFGSTKNDD
jgi:hypothetical protein